MKFLFPILFFSLFIFSCQIDSNTSFEENESAEDKRFPNEWFFAQRAYPSGKIDMDAYQDALAFRQMQIQRNQSKAIVDEWEFGGPTNIGGRISDVEMPPSSTDIIYAGAASGGIFKSEDQGLSWRPIFDNALSLSIGDIEIAPSDENIIYVGTGESNAGGGSLAYDGLGVYKSTDAGESWTHLGLEKIGSVGKVEVHPQNPNIAFVAAMGDLFGSNQERGVYRTLDGGANWEQVLFVSDSTGFIDLAIHPTQPGTIFAAAWERIRRPQYRRYSGATSGIYKSTDGGANWEMLTNGLPNQPDEKGRIGLAIAPSNPDVLYSMFVHESGRLTGLYKTENQGVSWNRISQNGVIDPPFMWWFGRLFVAPDDEKKVYLTSVESFTTDNAGSGNWQLVFDTAHVDQHSFFIHPKDPNLVVLGNDGGIDISHDKGLTHFKSNGLPITQFYTCELDYQFPNRLYGGTQDNSPMRTFTGGEDDWEFFWGGDGFVTLVDPNDNRYIYTESQHGVFARSTNGGRTYQSANGDLEGRFNWNTPFVFDPKDSKTLYIGSHQVYKTTNRADSWEPISNDLTNGDGGGNLTYGTITTLAVSPIDNQIIIAGTDDGNISLTTDGGANWQNVSEDLPNFWITKVIADTENPNTIYATISGFRYHDNNAHIFKSTDMGQNWEPISGNLPNIPVNDLVINPFSHELFIATDVGVYSSLNEGVTWELFGVGLPNVVITDLTFHEPNQILLAATYGRSMYKITVSPSTSTRDVAADLDFTVFPNPASESIQIRSDSQVETFQIFDLTGRLSLSGNVESNQPIGVDYLPKGKYVLMVKGKKKIGSAIFSKQ